jgi:thiamine-phosphate pyrophosphorylase
MSVTVRIDGYPARQLPAFRTALDALGPIPDESQRCYQIWSRAPQTEACADSVWLNPPSAAGRQAWLGAGGAILESQRTGEQTEDRLYQGDADIRVHSALQSPLDSAILAAFLAHDFSLVDALMLARAFRGSGWPDDLSQYPVPVGGPSFEAPFAPFPRHAGLYAVVPTAEWVGRLAQANVPVVQLRDKRADAALRALEVDLAVEAARGTRTLLFVNDDWRTAIEHGAYGVHLGQEDIEAADLNAIHSAGLRLGISTHGIYEMLRAHRCRPSYMAMGAIYATATKFMPTAPQGLCRLEHYIRLMSPHYPLVAIGGIDLSRIDAIWATGVDCAAVLRAIVDAPNYRVATSELLARTPQLHGVTGAI